MTLRWWKKSPKKSVRAAMHVRATVARVAMVKVHRQVLAVAVRAAAVPATVRLENNDAATETQEVSQRAEGS
ncbi:hypothetical protein BN2476_440009 [Paraburkholderia piptadeniae]|uniref:Uncharacterized protein n=1 Tax=Paraburkholderia piptadeniae TaxID=1701573 RepID=A0A1N7SBU8_9BURK|nr:hypothetical protein BN2476_440009 [Paraburkholderia piptadeniae]